MKKAIIICLAIVGHSYLRLIATRFYGPVGAYKIVVPTGINTKLLFMILYNVTIFTANMVDRHLGKMKLYTFNVPVTYRIVIPYFMSPYHGQAIENVYFPVLL